MTQIAYELEPINPRVTAHFTTFELFQDLAIHNIPAAKLWLENDPFDGMDCDHSCDPEAPCVRTPVAENMRDAWTHPAVGVIFLRPQAEAWTFWMSGCAEGKGPVVANAPYYDIAMQLYDEFWWLEKTIILGDWEQDWVIRGRGCRDWDFPFAEWDPWYGDGCQTQCMEKDGSTAEGCRRSCGQEMLGTRATWVAGLIDRRQADVERARADARMKFGRTNLTVLHAAVVNRYPANEDLDGPRPPWVAEIIPTLEHQPDLLGLSYYADPEYLVDTLDWLRATTGYPRHRIYLDELGERADLQNKDQYQEIMDVVTRYWDWGGKLAFVWMWRQTWCDKNYGLFEQVQPCEGKVVWGEPTGGYRAVKELNERSATWQTK